MNEREFEILESIDERHWWFVGKRHLLRALLDSAEPPRRIVDLGCGSGGVLRDWSEPSLRVGVDRSLTALRICASRGLGHLIRADLGRLPLAGNCFDLVLALDVIEHLDDDVGFLRRSSGLCSKDGRLIIAVPAFPFLWSRHDETFEHRRRYTAASLARAVRSAGLEPVRITYTNALLFPIAAVWRVLVSRLAGGRWAPRTDFVSLPRPLNALISVTYRFEAWLLRRWDLPAGLSVVCIARPASR